MENNFFFQYCNPTTGKMEWKAEKEDEYDYFKDIARSSYADMLHDKERNALYYKAIKLAVKQIHSQGKVAKVLDIGTGTGLLSMMAATAGAEIINAIEVFTPMAKVARRIVKRNGFPHINIINKHSTEVLFGEDIKERCNIIITELFDTELIGEGALNSYQHAHKHFMEEDCLAVPHRAMVYAQVVESSLLTSWNELSVISNDMIRVEPDERMRDEIGLSTVHDIQLSQITPQQFNPISHPCQIFEFDWSSSKLCTTSKMQYFQLKSLRSGEAQVVLSWWDLEMFKDSDIILSTAPKWLHPTPDDMQWRDHWIQSIYYLPNKVKVEKDGQFMLKAFHDDYTMWFEAYDTKEMEKATSEETIILPLCSYPPRALLSRPRMGMLNDVERNNKITRAFTNILSKNKQLITQAICVGDFSLISLILAKHPHFDGQVVAHERSKIAQRGLYNMARHNDIGDDDDRLQIVYADTLASLRQQLSSSDHKFQLLISEPFFTSSQLPWHDLYLWYARTQLRPHLADNVIVMPRTAHLWVVGLSLRDLHKIRAPVGQVEGFDVSLMDEMINKALDKKEDHQAEPHHLWEYPNKLVTSPTRVMTFDFTHCVASSMMMSEGKMDFTSPSTSSSSVDDVIASHCHGVALWMEYELDEDPRNRISTGLLSTTCGTPVWCKHHKQAVYLLKHPFQFPQDADDDEAGGRQQLNYHIEFEPSSGELTTRFNIN